MIGADQGPLGRRRAHQQIDEGRQHARCPTRVRPSAQPHASAAVGALDGQQDAEVRLAEGVDELRAEEGHDDVVAHAAHGLAHAGDDVAVGLHGAGDIAVDHARNQEEAGRSAATIDRISGELRARQPAVAVAPG